MVPAVPRGVSADDSGPIGKPNRDEDRMPYPSRYLQSLGKMVSHLQGRSSEYKAFTLELPCKIAAAGTYLWDMPLTELGLAILEALHQEYPAKLGRTC